MAEKMVSLIICAFWLLGTIFFFFLFVLFQPNRSPGYTSVTHGGKSVHTRALYDTALSMSIVSTWNKKSVVELCRMSYLTSGTIPLPNSTLMGHLRGLRVR